MSTAFDNERRRMEAMALAFIKNYLAAMPAGWNVAIVTTHAETDDAISLGVFHGFADDDTIRSVLQAAAAQYEQDGTPEVH